VDSGEWRDREKKADGVASAWAIAKKLITVNEGRRQKEPFL